MRTPLGHGSQDPTIRAPTRVPHAHAEPVIHDRRSRSAGPLVLGRYRLRRRLGAGAFATVWLARDERLERDVAVKILARERVLGGRFEREARATARLSHPGIVTLYEAAVDDEGAYLVSELIHGTTLDRLLRDGRLSDRDVVQIGIALCDALAHAHSGGVIHRDVKPSNVLVPASSDAPSVAAKLTDFGVARVLGGDTLTRTGDVIGTMAYMAPEQAEGRTAGAPADLYSLALVLYEALTGVNPVATEAGGQRVRRLGAHLPPLRRQRRDLPRELGQAIDLALRPRPSERGSVAELRAALALVLDHLADEPGVVASPWPTLTRRPGALEAGAFREAPLLEQRRRDRTPGAGPDAAEESAGGKAPGLPWPRRALAAVAAAALGAWLARNVPGASPAPVALTAFIAGVLVAALPRAGWLALAAAMSVSLILHGRPGGGLLLLAAALVPVIQSPRDGPSWPLAAGAPALGAIGLAGAWPGAAGGNARARRRVALAITGWLWLALAGGLQSTSIAALDNVLHPLLSASGLLPAAVWGAAALVLPWLRSRRSPALAAALLAAWAAALALGTIAVSGGGSGHAYLSSEAALVGAYTAALVALLTRLPGRWVYPLETRTTRRHSRTMKLQ